MWPRVSRFMFTVVGFAGLFVFLSPELKNVSRETFAAETTTNEQVSQSLTCQCGCGLTVANCNMPTCSFSVPTRLEIDRMIGNGMGRAQIIAFYRHKYGEKVLSAPTAEGFNLLAWTMPFIALAFTSIISFVTGFMAANGSSFGEDMTSR